MQFGNRVNKPICDEEKAAKAEGAKDLNGNKEEAKKAAAAEHGVTLAEQCAAAVVALEDAKRKVEEVAGVVGRDGVSRLAPLRAQLEGGGIAVMEAVLGQTTGLGWEK